MFQIGYIVHVHRKYDGRAVVTFPLFMMEFLSWCWLANAMSACGAHNEAGNINLPNRFLFAVLNNANSGIVAFAAHNISIQGS